MIEKINWMYILIAVVIGIVVGNYFLNQSTTTSPIQITKTRTILDIPSPMGTTADDACLGSGCSITTISIHFDRAFIPGESITYYLSSAARTTYHCKCNP